MSFLSSAGGLNFLSEDQRTLLHKLKKKTGESLHSSFNNKKPLRLCVFSPNKAAGDRRGERGHTGDEGGKPEDDEGEEGDHPRAFPLSCLPPAHPGRHHAAAVSAAVRDQRCESNNQ